MRPGDFVITEAKGPLGWMVGAITLSRYCHVRLVIDEDGTCISADRDGAVLDAPRPGEIIVSPPLTDEQRGQIRETALPLLGTPYGFWDAAVLGLAHLGYRSASLERQIERPDRLFCSQLVDLVWSRVGFHAFNDGRLPQNVTPGDLADLALRSGWTVVNPIS